MAPHLLFNPVFHKREASAGMPDGKVIDPAPQNRVDERNHSADGLGGEPPENLLQLATRLPTTGTARARASGGDCRETRIARPPEETGRILSGLSVALR